MPRAPRPDDFERAGGCIAYGILAIALVLGAIAFSLPFLVLLLRKP